MNNNRNYVAPRVPGFSFNSHDDGNIIPSRNTKVLSRDKPSHGNTGTNTADHFAAKALKKVHNSRTSPNTSTFSPYMISKRPKKLLLSDGKLPKSVVQDHDAESSDESSVRSFSTLSYVDTQAHLEMLSNAQSERLRSTALERLRSTALSRKTLLLHASDTDGIPGSSSPVGIVPPTQSPVCSPQPSTSNYPHAEATPEQQVRPLSLGRYKTKNGNGQKGKGFVLILVNFMDELPGYDVDVQAITQFFKTVLRCDVFGGSDTPAGELPRYRNLSREGMRGILRDLQQQMSSPFTPSYDRLFIFILSHGDENGIKTCHCTADGAVVPETDQHGRSVSLSPEEMVAMFHHDKVPSLRGYPKCFFLQTCRGTQALQAAADTMHALPRGPIALGADTAVFYASSYGHMAYVPQGGSWFIQETIAAMTQYHREAHLLEIMTEVVNIVSAKADEVQSQGRAVPAHQLPTIVSNLTKLFYLCN